MRYFKIIIALMTISANIFAQEGTNLFQIITANLQVERPQVIRDLQSYIDTEMQDTLQGVNIEILHQKVDQYKKKILKYIKPGKFVQDNGTIKFIYKADTIKVAVYDDMNIGQILNNFELSLKERLDTAFQGIHEKNKFAKYLNFLVYAAINKFVLQEKVVYEDSKGSYKDLIMKLISKIAKDQLLTQFKIQFPQYDERTKISEIVQKKIINELNNFSDLVVALLTDQVVRTFDKIHTKITNEIEKPLSQNLKGLTGISFSEGTGNFAGGMLYHFQNRKCDFHLSFYLNGNLNIADDDSSTHSLIGFQISHTGENYQVDLLASIYFGDKKFENAKVFEIGLGYSRRFSGESLIGIAGFYLRNTEYKNTYKNDSYAFGLMFKISKKAPSVVLGFSAGAKASEKVPILQVNFPINITN